MIAKKLLFLLKSTLLPVIDKDNIVNNIPKSLFNLQYSYKSKFYSDSNNIELVRFNNSYEFNIFLDILLGYQFYRYINNNEVYITKEINSLNMVDI